MDKETYHDTASRLHIACANSDAKTVQQIADGGFSLDCYGGDGTSSLVDIAMFQSSVSQIVNRHVMVVGVLGRFANCQDPSVSDLFFVSNSQRSFVCPQRARCQREY